MRAVVLVILGSLAACGALPADYGITGPGLAGSTATPAPDSQDLNPLSLPPEAGFAGGTQGFAQAPLR